MLFRRLAIGVSLAFLAAQTNAAEVSLPPPYQGAYQPRGVDEAGMWHELDEDERELASSNLVIHDENLTSYLKQVLCRVVGGDRCKAVRIYVMREPTFNATMAPNGTMRVFSGLLLRVRNEAELGAVLGHEFGHFESRHSLEAFKKQRKGTNLLAWAAVLGSMAPNSDTRRAYENLELSVYGSLFKFGRNQEREADLLGIAYLNKSELPPQSASKVWQNLMSEIDASVALKGLRKPNYNAIAFTATHPPEGERATYLSKLADPKAQGRDDGHDRFIVAIRPWLPIFLADQIKLNDFGASEYIIQSLAETGWSADLWFARGELYRARGNQRDLVNAAEFYGNALQLDAGRAEAHRGMGLALIKIGRTTEGQSALRAYLALVPNASDASMIRMMLPKEVSVN